jgi:predicted MFS family arabinose efflux permease
LDERAIVAPLAGGASAFALFVGYERRIRQPMLTLGLFSRRNFAIANTETFAMYAGIAILFFFLVIYLQQVAGYGAFKSGLTTLPETAVMFVLSRRAGALADRFGPRLFMGAGPVIAAAGVFLLARLGTGVSFLTDLLPALLVFALGLPLTVAPLTAGRRSVRGRRGADLEISPRLGPSNWSMNESPVRVITSALFRCRARSPQAPLGSLRGFGR